MQRTTLRSRPTLRVAMAVMVAASLAAGCGEKGGGAGDRGDTASGGRGGPVVQDGSSVSFHYTLKVDGEVVDSSEGRDPFTYTQGQHMIVAGLEEQMLGLAAGDKKDVVVTPEKGYGTHNPMALQEVPRSVFPNADSLEVGDVVQGRSPDGRPMQAKVAEIGDENITLDMNHPLAGKTLNFTIEVVSVEDPGSTPPPTP